MENGIGETESGEMTDRRRVVITGMGVTSALGDTPEALYDALRSGRSAVRLMFEWQEAFDRVPPAAPVELDEERVKAIPRKFRRAMGDAALYAAKERGRNRVELF